jgi:myo-inositol-1(or 4)-monophosphatase
MERYRLSEAIVSQYNKKDLELATQSIQAARSRLDTGSAEDGFLENIDGREWKIRVDRELESVILKVLQEGSDYPVLSEESGILTGRGSRQWIVDPLDGSVNFFREVPMYCISVGLWENQSPLLGAVLEIPGNRLFSGIVGVGAWCNGKPIERKIEAPDKPSEALLCTGFPAEFEHSQENIQTLLTACESFGKVRMLGSAALMLCYVASGRCDSYWERQIALWDIGAALAIVQAAGGVTRFGKISGNHRLDVEAASCESLLVSEVDGK